MMMSIDDSGDEPERRRWEMILICRRRWEFKKQKWSYLSQSTGPIDIVSVLHIGRSVSYTRRFYISVYQVHSVS
jgi:hypothetical protein